MKEPPMHDVRVGRVWIACWRWGGCFRVWGYGLHLRRDDGITVFSERYGYTKVWRFMGWKLKTLKP